MYLAGTAIIRANLDGSDAVEILSGTVRANPGIALDLRKPIPAVSEWGLVLLTLTLLTAATLILHRRPTPRKI